MLPPAIHIKLILSTQNTSAGHRRSWGTPAFPLSAGLPEWGAEPALFTPFSEPGVIKGDKEKRVKKIEAFSKN